MPPWSPHRPLGDHGYCPAPNPASPTATAPAAALEPCGNPRRNALPHANVAVAPRSGWSAANDERARAAGYKTWGAWVAQRELDLGHTVCGACTNAGKPCGMNPEAVNGRCRHHGAASLWGPFHGNYQGKGAGKYMPKDLLALYEEIDEAELYSMADLQRVAMTMHRHLLERMDHGESATKWERLRELAGDLALALAEDNQKALMLAAEDVVRIVGDAPSMAEQLAAVRDQEDHYRKLFEAEVKRARVESDYMHKREVLTLFEQIARDMAAALAEHPKLRADVANRLSSRLGSAWGAPGPSAN